MRTPDIEGVAIHDGPESCVGVREGARSPGFRRAARDLRTESWPRGSGKPTSAVSCPIHVPGLRACRP
jgi:hypothetical protein